MSVIERKLRDEIAELGEQIDRSEEAYAAMRADRDRVQLLADARQRQLAGAVEALREIDEDTRGQSKATQGGRLGKIARDALDHLGGQ